MSMSDPLAVRIRLKRLPHAQGLPLPAYASPGASGMDVCAAVEEEVVLAPGQVGLVPTGVQVEIPAGYEIQVRPRSGLALRNRIGLLNSPGTVDSDYRGEIQIILINFGSEPFAVRRGDRIAQLVVARVERGKWVETQDLGETERGEGGFGSSGI